MLRSGETKLRTSFVGTGIQVQLEILCTAAVM